MILFKAGKHNNNFGYKMLFVFAMFGFIIPPYLVIEKLVKTNILIFGILMILAVLLIIFIMKCVDKILIKNA